MAPTHTTLAPSTHPRTRPTAIVCPHPWSVSPLPMVSVHPLPPISVSSLPQVPLSPYPRSVSPWTLVSVFPLPTISMPPHPRSLCPQDPLPIMNTFSQACRQEWWGADRPLTPVSGGLWTCLQPALWMGTASLPTPVVDMRRMLLLFWPASRGRPSRLFCPMGAPPPALYCFL